MARTSSRSSKRGLWRGVILLIIAGAVWWSEYERADIVRTERAEHVAEHGPGGILGMEQTDHLERLENARWIEDSGNDGDSFLVAVGGEKLHLRLYYVDAAEKYLSDRYENQRERVADQAKDFGGLTLDQTTDLGNRAKAHVAQLLRGKTFTVYTKFESVYNSERRYGYVELPNSDKLLSEELVEQGLARIHTQGTISPDGESYYDFKRHLEGLERDAQSAGRGAWGLK
jgi:endonuclease YncB( thermonuclease family)